MSAIERNTMMRHTKKREIPIWAKKPAFVVGIIIVLTAILISFFPQFIAPYDPIEVNSKAILVAPSAEHFFGTDNFGRDVFSRVIWAARIDLQIGVFATIVPLIFGSMMGLIAGYYGGIVDNILMRIIDILMTFPFTILVIVIMTILGQGMKNIYIAIWLVGWMAYAKLVRGEVLVLKNAEFIEAARVTGFSDKRILLRHMLPNVVSSAVVFAASDVVLCMLTGASMSFLGLGVQPPTPEWGAILNEGRAYIMNAWWITFFPGLFMAITGIGFSLLGDGLTDFLRTKGK
ncbi:ABC transporter permease [Gottschalkiaceae bacterium SANA]|nr:ABC transporter permease [Gottschalkiaceae bacterium SANA]